MNALRRSWPLAGITLLCLGNALLVGAASAARARAVAADASAEGSCACASEILSIRRTAPPPSIDDERTLQAAYERIAGACGLTPDQVRRVRPERAVSKPGSPLAERTVRVSLGRVSAEQAIAFAQGIELGPGSPLVTELRMSATRDEKGARWNVEAAAKYTLPLQRTAGESSRPAERTQPDAPRR